MLTNYSWFLGVAMSGYAKCLSSGLVILALIGAADAKEHPHVAEADREYAVVLSHDDNPCAKESTTLGWDQCLGNEVKFTETHMTRSWQQFAAFWPVRTVSRQAQRRLAREKNRNC